MMERINAYSIPAPDGGIFVDLEGMMVDMVTVIKAGGITKSVFLAKISETFDKVEVKVSIPENKKN